MRYLAFCITLLLACTSTYRLQAAEMPASLQALFNRIPALPENIDAATAWVDGDGNIIAPSVLELTADLEKQKQAITVIASAQNEATHERSMTQMEQITTGMSNAGIDVQRLQSDPAYAQQMQARMQKMSPQELMALSQQMSQPMREGKAVPNEAQLLANDSPAVKRAAAAGSAYINAQAQRVQANDAIWQKAEAEIKQLQSQPLKVSATKPRADWDDTACNKACLAQWDVYTAQAVPLLEARANKILQIRSGALHAHRNALAKSVATADQYMQATAYGSAAQSHYHLSQITGYATTVIGDIEHLLGHLNRSVEQAAYVKQCATQMIRSPHAICIRDL